ncbi:MAG: hypothetical protein IPJ71_17520 [Bdellovibrionales bacterium]|nr:hypothetical protein [Bdellovibrionales bacterium]
MRNRILFAVAVVFTLAIPFLDAGASTPPRKEKEVVVGVNDAFIPSGFDAESEAYVVVAGLFSNTCYRWKRADVGHDWATKIHEVRAVAGVSEGMCLMMMVPFTQSVTLGKLGVGEHRIRFIDGNDNYLEKTLTIE